MQGADLAIARLSVRQFGLATRPQLVAAGLTEDQIDGRLASGQLIRLHPRVYRAAAVTPSYEQAVMAACLAVSGAVASHRCAARLFRLRGFERYSGVELTVQGQRAPRLVGVVGHATLALERTTMGIIPVALPAQVLLGVAATSCRLAEGAVNGVLQRGLTSAPALVRFLGRRAARGRNGTALLRRLVAEQIRAGAPTESWLEDRLVEFLRLRGFPDPVRQHAVELSARRMRLDLAWPGPGLAVEADGRLFHTSPSQRRRDVARDALLAAAGWAVERVTWLQLEEEPDEVDARLRRRLSRAALRGLAA